MNLETQPETPEFHFIKIDYSTMISLETRPSLSQANLSLLSRDLKGGLIYPFVCCKW